MQLHYEIHMMHVQENFRLYPHLYVEAINVREDVQARTIKCGDLLLFVTEEYESLCTLKFDEAGEKIIEFVTFSGGLTELLHGDDERKQQEEEEHGHHCHCHQHSLRRRVSELCTL